MAKLAEPRAAPLLNAVLEVLPDAFPNGDFRVPVNTEAARPLLEGAWVCGWGVVLMVAR